MTVVYSEITDVDKTKLDSIPVGGVQGPQIWQSTTPTALSGNVNDYSPSPGLSTFSVLRLDGGVADRTITGLVPGFNNQVVLLENIGTTNNLILSNQDGASTAANRFIGVGGANVTIPFGGSVILWYDPTSTRWRVASASAATVTFSAVQAALAGATSTVNIPNAGSGAAVTATGGSSSGAAFVGTGGSPNGIGVDGIGTGTGAGVRGTGTGVLATGVIGQGGSAGTGGSFTGGAGGPGIIATGGTGSTNGLQAVGRGTSAGVLGDGESGTSGGGVRGRGGGSGGIGGSFTGGVFGGTGTGTGVFAQGGANGGYGADIRPGASSTQAVLHIEPQAAPTATHVVGDEYTDTSGRKWVCTAAGTPGTFSLVGPHTTNTVNAAGGTTTTSTTDVLLTTMTITPGAGDYIALFQGSFNNSNNGNTVTISLYVNGVKVTNSEVSQSGQNANVRTNLGINTVITGVGAGQAVEIRWRTNANTATAQQRRFSLVRIA